MSCSRWLGFVAFALLVLTWSPSLGAKTIQGGDWNGRNLTPSNGDVLSGTFRNVGTFTVQPGTTIRIQSGTVFEMNASNIVVAGTLSANGAGHTGGAGAQAPSSYGSDGSGSGGGKGGQYGNCCVHPDGGGGGGYGGDGGRGANPFDGSTADGGGTYGSRTNRNSLLLGSGGGGGGSNASGYSGDGYLHQGFQRRRHLGCHRVSQ